MGRGADQIKINGRNQSVTIPEMTHLIVAQTASELVV
jgi:hypothetical protein